MDPSKLTDEEIKALQESAVQGMLWLDDGKDAITEKIQRAVAFFEKKHNRKCKSIALHPKAFLSEKVPEKVDGIPISANKTVLLHHIFVGDDAPAYSTEGAEI